MAGINDDMVKEMQVESGNESLDDEVARYVAMLDEIGKDALTMFRSLPHQDQIFTCPASELLVTGGNRSSKTISAAVRFASIATKMPVTLSNGQKIKPPFHDKHPLNMWVIGFDNEHIGKTLHRVLFRDGLFRIIKDKKTGLMRAANPYDKDDVAREAETKPSPPLIPPRFYDLKQWSWEDKGNRVFNVARLLDGTEIRAYSSRGHAAMGDPVHFIWIDEDIAESESVAEWQARLSDLRGRLHWSGYGYCKNDAMVRMQERAAQQADRKNPDVVHIQLSTYDNPFIPKDELRKRTEGWTPDEIRARMLGEMVMDTILCYPNYSPHVHDLEKTGARDQADKLFIANGFRPPDDWNNWLIVDPGHTVAAGLFVSVPPPHLNSRGRYLWNLVYDRNSDSIKFAKACKEAAGGCHFEGFIIDKKAGDQTSMGATKRVRTIYSEAFEAVGLTSRTVGSEFYPGSPNEPARMMIVRDGFCLGLNDNLPVWRLRAENLYWLKYELARYKKVVLASTGGKGQPRDKAVDKDNHALNALEYFAAAEAAGKCEWNPPDPPKKKLTAVQQYLLDEEKEAKRRAGPNSGSVYCGAGVPNESYAWM